MGTTSIFLFFLALLDGLNPISIGLFFVILQRTNGIAKKLAYILGIFVSSFTGALVIVFGLSYIFEQWLTDVSVIRYVIEVMLGIACVVFGYLSRFKASRSTRTIANTEVLTLFMLGMLVNGTDLITMFPFFVAMELIAGTNLGWCGLLLQLLFYHMVLVLPLLILQWMNPTSARGNRRTTIISKLVEQHSILVMQWLSAIVGILLTTNGAWRLINLQMFN